MKMNMPRAFFENHVKRNLEDWKKEPLAEHRAKNLVGELNTMAERVFNYWRDRDPSKIRDAGSAGRYRDHLATSECGDFGLIRDVAEAHKHVALERTDRRVTHHTQTGKGALGFGEGGFGEAGFGGGETLVIGLDDGTKRPLSAVVDNVIKMWERLLTQWGL